VALRPERGSNVAMEKCPGSPGAVRENPGNQEYSRSNKISKRYIKLTWIGEQAGGISRLNQQQVADNIDVDVTCWFYSRFCVRMRPSPLARARRGCCRIRFLRRSAIVVAETSRETIKELFATRDASRIFIRFPAKSLEGKRRRAGTRGNLCSIISRFLSVVTVSLNYA